MLLREQWRQNSRKNERMEPKQRQHPIVDGTDDGIKIQCYSEQYCIRTWIFRPMNQGKLEVVKEEMTRVNINILGISELKWTGMGEFHSDDHYIYYCGQESLRKDGVAITVNKRVCNAVLECKLKNERITSVCFHGKPFNITMIQVYAPTSNAEEAEVEQFYEDLKDVLVQRKKKKTSKKHFLFFKVGWNAKVGRQETLGVTHKFGHGVQNETGQRLIRVLPKECTVHSKHPLSVTQEKALHMDITRWSTL